MVHEITVIMKDNLYVLNLNMVLSVEEIHHNLVFGKAEDQVTQQSSCFKIRGPKWLKVLLILTTVFITHSNQRGMVYPRPGNILVTTLEVQVSCGHTLLKLDRWPS